MISNTTSCPSEYHVIELGHVDDKFRAAALLTQKDFKESCASKPMVYIDYTLDFIPLVSTITNIADLILKGCCIKGLPAPQSSMKSYIRHLHEKSAAACFIYAIPLIGNLFKLGVCTYQSCTKNAPPSIKELEYLNRYLDELVTVSGQSKLDESESNVTI